MTDPQKRALTDAEITRYARQLILPEIGDAGQDALTAARLLIIGAGGLGTPALIMAASAGFGQITLMDDDVIDQTNLNRQFLYSPDDVGKAKSEIAAAVGSRQNPHITITALTTRLTTANASALFADHDIVIDASDNPATRYLANRAALESQTPLIFVSAIRFEGQLALFAPHLSATPDTSPCYHCLFPEQPDVAQAPNCATIGIAGPVTALLGSHAALEAIKFITKAGTNLCDHLWLFDGLNHSSSMIKTKRDKNCPVCCHIS